MVSSTLSLEDTQESGINSVIENTLSWIVLKWGSSTWKKVILLFHTACVVEKKLPEVLGLRQEAGVTHVKKVN